MLTARRSQRTIAQEAEVQGVGFLTGADVKVRFRPAQADTGIVFVRADLPDKPRVPAHVRHVVPRQRRTTIQDGSAVVEMVEHVMAALSGLKIDNCEIEIDASETPGCDGSSFAFAEALRGAGTVEQDRPKAALVIDRPITVREGDATLTATPGPSNELMLTYNLDYGPTTPIGRQSLALEITPEAFRDELASSRTFLLEAEAHALRAAGIGVRTTTRDLLVFGPEGPIDNALRYPDECVRHKMLDVVGDLALLGVDIAGHVVADRSGHQLNASLVRKLLDAIEQGPRPIAAELDALTSRHPLQLVDRVVESIPGRRVVAAKVVTSNEPFFPKPWSTRPMMPGVMVLESLSQTAGLVVAPWLDPTSQSAWSTAIDGVRFHAPVAPGDELRLEAEIVGREGDQFDIQACARVDGTTVAEALFRLVVRSK